MTKDQESNLIVEKRIHQGWHELDTARKKGLSLNIPSVVGKYQYIYTTKKGKISLIELPNYFLDGIDLWEIYSLEGELFEDVERFKSKEQVEVRIKELLVVI